MFVSEGISPTGRLDRVKTFGLAPEPTEVFQTLWTPNMVDLYLSIRCEDDCAAVADVCGNRRSNPSADALEDVFPGPEQMVEPSGIEPLTS